MEKGKLRIAVDPGFGGSEKQDRQYMSVEDILADAACDWDRDDPGVGRAMILKGREIFNPVPMAPPVGYVDQPSMFDQLYAKLRAEMMNRRDEEVVDTVDEMNDFPDDDEPVFNTDYEIVMMEDFPTMPAPLEDRLEPSEEAVKAVQVVDAPAVGDTARPKKKPPEKAAEAEEA